MRSSWKAEARREKLAHDQERVLNHGIQVAKRGMNLMSQKRFKDADHILAGCAKLVEHDKELTRHSNYANKPQFDANNHRSNRFLMGVYYNRSICLEHLKDLDRAKLYADVCCKYMPRFWKSYYRLAHVLVSMSYDRDAALALLKMFKCVQSNIDISKANGKAAEAHAQQLYEFKLVPREQVLELMKACHYYTDARVMASGLHFDPAILRNPMKYATVVDTHGAGNFRAVSGALDKLLLHKKQATITVLVAPGVNWGGMTLYSRNFRNKSRKQPRRRIEIVGMHSPLFSFDQEEFFQTLQESHSPSKPRKRKHRHHHTSATLDREKKEEAEKARKEEVEKLAEQRRHKYQALLQVIGKPIVSVKPQTVSTIISRAHAFVYENAQPRDDDNFSATDVSDDDDEGKDDHHGHNNHYDGRCDEFFFTNISLLRLPSLSDRQDELFQAARGSRAAVDLNLSSIYSNVKVHFDQCWISSADPTCYCVRQQGPVKTLNIFKDCELEAGFGGVACIKGRMRFYDCKIARFHENALVLVQQSHIECARCEFGPYGGYDTIYTDNTFIQQEKGSVCINKQCEIITDGMSSEKKVVAGQLDLQALDDLLQSSFQDLYVVEEKQEFLSSKTTDILESVSMPPTPQLEEDSGEEKATSARASDDSNVSSNEDDESDESSSSDDGHRYATVREQEFVRAEKKHTKEMFARTQAALSRLGRVNTRQPRKPLPHPVTKNTRKRVTFGADVKP